MRKIKYEIDTGYAGCSSEGTMEFPDDTLDGVIDHEVWLQAQDEAQSWEGDERIMSEEDWQKAENIESFYADCDGWWEEVNE